MGSPQDNDAWNAKFAVKYGSAVIALNYAKAPKNAFPGPIHVSDESTTKASTSLQSKYRVTDRIHAVA